MLFDFIPKHCLISKELFFQLIKFMNIIQDILIELGKCSHDGLYIIKSEFWAFAEVYKSAAL